VQSVGGSHQLSPPHGNRSVEVKEHKACDLEVQLTSFILLVATGRLRSGSIQRLLKSTETHSVRSNYLELSKSV
jgi:hypothetical protein